MLDVNRVNTIAQTIIEHQQNVIGPLALVQANKVSGLKVSDGDNIRVEVNGEVKAVLTDLVKKYEEMFGRASIEVCKDAVKEVKPPVPHEELPDILQ